MSPSRPRTRKTREKALKRVLALPDLEHAKSAVLASLTSASGQRTYAHAIREFVAEYGSEARAAFNRTVELRYRIQLEQRQRDCSLPRLGPCTARERMGSSARTTLWLRCYRLRRRKFNDATSTSDRRP